MKQKKMAQPPTITQTLQADRITWLQIPTTFHEKGGGGGGGGRRSLRESHTPRKAAVSQKVVSRPSSRVWLAELMKCLALAAPVSTPFSFFLNRNV